MNNKKRNGKASTTTWDVDWLYMRKQKSTADNELEVKQTPTHVVHEAKICRTWEGNYNISFSIQTPWVFSLS